LADAQRRWKSMPKAPSEAEKLKLQLDAVFDRLIDFLEAR
jgi:hypothetical protein